MDRFDMVVVGAGPGGYVAAIRGAQLGLKVALVDKRERLGGTCLNVGCIPSKALLESSHHYATARAGLAEHGVGIEGVTLDLPALMTRKQAVVEQLTDGIATLMKKNKVQLFVGQARLAAADRVDVDRDGEVESLPARNIVLATGSAAVELPGLPFDGERIVSSTEALSFAEVPEHLVVIGAGAVGLELGQCWQRLGSKVTVVEMQPQIVPSADKLIARMLLRALKAQGMEFLLDAKVSGAEVADSGLHVTVELPKGKTDTLRCDKLLVAVGRRPFYEGLGLEDVGVALDEHGFISVDERLRTSLDGVWAIGDVVPGPMLAHKAEDEGVAVAERIAGLPGHVAYAHIPGVVYTWPEMAQVGLTEEQAKERGLKFNKGQFYFRANGRALAAGDTDGLVKILADERTDEILGVHLVGPNASELIAEAVLAMEYKASAEDLARTVHAHPTLSEAVREAALAVDGRAIHA